jgi:DNA-binding MarR family transcriptional regulator
MAKEVVEKIREFNRFYTSIIGVTNNHILESNYSLTEVRVMHEASNNPGITARQLKALLQVDEGYLSRLIAKLVKQKILLKKQSKEDKRIFSLELSEKGKQMYTEFNKRSNDSVAALIQHLGNNDQIELVKLLNSVKTLLTKNK